MNADGRVSAEQIEQKPYDKGRLSYAGTFTNPWKAGTIRAIEWATAKLKLLSLIRKFERRGAPFGQPFWPQALEIMGINVTTPPEQIARIPKEGPLVVVANHPHGLVDGMVLAYLIGQVRTDYKILTRSLLTGIPEIAEFMLPVPFPHEPNAQEESLKMRAECMSTLKAGGVIVLFPAGAVAHSKTYFGPAIEGEWNPFTAKMLARSGASVLPIHFPGKNSRLYQIANKLSPTLRQGLLLYEIRRALNKPQHPVVGHAKSAEDIAAALKNPRQFLADLRAETLALRN
ncbi:putative hemolysin [Rhodobacter sp. JA431]|uniref:lysophospholipid acyltransferase family protein n=1 Tax=Rhodobacter sp. JA431 TaxID=570013 RepID=UPI000BD39E8D|nr:lysophospholipid acyltransferase family protein [Rhodobacter sp. JA431]SOB93557.1 putative hemolysin [Rhodobacter sp. JA431]